MPVYHFTFHAYGTWMPDRPEGYVHHTQGLQATNHKLADLYIKQAGSDPVEFQEPHQQILIDAALEASQHQRYTIQAIGTDPTHLHVLLQWDDDRDWSTVRNGLKSSLTRQLNLAFGKRPWFVENASRKRVKDRSHFDHLKSNYIPKHSGLKWNAQRGIYR